MSCNKKMGRPKLSGIKGLYINDHDELKICYAVEEDTRGFTKGSVYKEVVGRHIIVGVVSDVKDRMVTVIAWNIIPHVEPKYPEPDDEFIAYMSDRY